MPIIKQLDWSKLMPEQPDKKRPDYNFRSNKKPASKGGKAKRNATL